MANSQVGFLQIKLGLTGPEAIRRSGDYPRFAKRFCPLGYMGGIILGAVLNSGDIPSKNRISVEIVDYR